LSIRTRAVHLAVVIVVSTVGVAAALASTTSVAATADSYDVYACYAGQGTYLNPGDSAVSWSLAENNGSAYYLPFDQCGGSDNGFGVISRSGYIAPAGDYGEVFFEAPAGLRISRVQLWRSLYDYGLGSGGSSQRNYAQNEADGILPSVGDEFDGSAEVPHGAAGSGDTTENGIVPSNYISIDLAASLPHTYAYVIGCGFASGCTTGGHDPQSPSGPDTVLKIYGAIVSVKDDAPPTLSLGNTGLLDGTTQSGTAPLTINAADAAGIAKVEIYAGNSVSSSSTQDFTQTSHCAFYEAVPCENLSNYQYPVDTTRLPNGTYYVTAKAYDPAGNAVAVSSPSPVTVENQPTTTLSSALTGANGFSAPHIANGQSPCAGETLNLTVNGKTKPPVILYGSTATIRGVLHCGTVPIRGARVVIATIGGPGTAAINSLAQTALDGSFSYRVPTGPDRTLKFSYTAFSDDPGPSASASAAIRIRPRIKLRITPHSSSNEHTIHWAGTVAGGPYPPEGVALDVEVQEGRSWRIFDQVVANRKGGFRYSYRFHATGEATTYTFRVALPHTGAQGYPYTPGASNTIDVHVTP
jgi:hypothetical protein